MTRLSLQSFPPLHSRFLGFDRLLSDIDRVLADAQASVAGSGFPPFNLYKEKHGYSIELALAGYRKEDIAVKHDKKNGTLIVSSEGSAQQEDKDRELIRSGIAARSFERVFNVADNLQVKSAKMENGLLTIHLERVEREEDKPLLITVN